MDRLGFLFMGYGIGLMVNKETIILGVFVLSIGLFFYLICQLNETENKK